MKHKRQALRIIVPDFKIEKWPVRIRRKQIPSVLFGRNSRQPHPTFGSVEATSGKAEGSAAGNAHRARPFTGQGAGAWR